MFTTISRYLLASSVALALLSTAVAGANTAVQPEPRDHNGWMKRHESLCKRAAQPEVDLLMIGDSITHGWEGPGKEVWAEYYADRNAINLGIGGDRTQHVLWRLQNGNLGDAQPKAAVLMIGTNNHKDNTPEEIAEGVIAIVDYLREQRPEMQILLLGIFPRDGEPDMEKRQIVATATELFAPRADGEMVHFLDIGQHFLDENGVLPGDIMPDSLHPNEKGYQIWASAMEDKVAELLGEIEQEDTLFNGATLDGWRQVGGEKTSWYTEPGILYTDGAGGGWLATDDEYGDFELQLDFKVREGGNSGVFCRAPLHGNPAFEGFEVQVLDDYAPKYRDLKPWQFCGSVYSVAAPKTRATKAAGEWQEMKIRVEGPRVQVWLNGEHIIDENVEDHEEKYKDHPGLKRREGVIGLQDHGERVEYRDIQITELD